MATRTIRRPAQKFAPISVTRDYKTGLSIKFTLIGWGLDYSRSEFWVDIKEELIHEDLAVLKVRNVRLKRQNEGEVIEQEYTENPDTGEITVISQTVITEEISLASDFKDGRPAGQQNVEQYAIATILPLFNAHIQSLP